MLERNLLRDKTLVLRILDERLQSHLREKMAALDEKSNQEASASSAASNSKASASLQNNVNAGSHATSTSTQNINNSEGRIFDLEGVTCEPAIQTRTPSSSSFLDDNMHKSSEDQAQAGAELLDQHTLWNFHCDGATYPARLINLPCPIEIHKTHDHAMYYKCCDNMYSICIFIKTT